MAYRLNTEQVMEFKEVFDMYAKPPVNTLSIEELGELMEAVGNKMTKAQLKRTANSVGVFNDGRIDFPSYLIIMEDVMKDLDPKNEILKAYKAFCRDDGLISTSELRHMLITLQDEMSEEDIDYMIMEADKDQDGLISYQEFEKMIMSS